MPRHAITRRRLARTASQPASQAFVVGLGGLCSNEIESAANRPNRPPTFSHFQASYRINECATAAAEAAAAEPVSAAADYDAAGGHYNTSDCFILAPRAPLAPSLPRIGDRCGPPRSADVAARASQPSSQPRAAFFLTLVFFEVSFAFAFVLPLLQRTSCLSLVPLARSLASWRRILLASYASSLPFLCSGA